MLPPKKTEAPVSKRDLKVDLASIVEPPINIQDVGPKCKPATGNSARFLDFKEPKERAIHITSYHLAGFRAIFTDGSLMTSKVFGSTATTHAGINFHPDGNIQFMTGRNCAIRCTEHGCEAVTCNPDGDNPECCLSDPAMHDCCKLLWENELEEVGPKQEKIIKTFIPKVDAFFELNGDKRFNYNVFVKLNHTVHKDSYVEGKLEVIKTSSCEDLITETIPSLNLKIKKMEDDIAQLQKDLGAVRDRVSSVGG